MGKTLSKEITVTHRGNITTLDFDWTISSFEALTANAVGYCATQGIQPPSCDTKFSLNFYPCGFNERTKDYIAVCLERTSDEEIRVRFTCSIVDSKGKELCNRSTIRNLALETIVGWTTFCKRDVILPVTSDPVMKCKIEIFKSLTNEDEDFQSLEELSCDLEGLLEEGLHSDFVLRVEGEALKIHKSVLCARSPVFKTMFHSSWENGEKETAIDDVSFSAMKILVKYLYTGRLDYVEVNEAMEVYYASDKYEIFFLKDAFSKVLAGKLLPDNVIKILLLSYRHSDNDLQDTCFSYMDKHLKEIKGRDEWIDLMKNYPKLADRALFFHESVSTSKENPILARLENKSKVLFTFNSKKK